MKESLFATTGSRIFVVFRQGVLISHFIEDNEMFQYKNVTRKLSETGSIIYFKRLKEADKRSLSDLIYEYKILGCIMELGESRQEIGAGI